MAKRVQGRTHQTKTRGMIKLMAGAGVLGVLALAIAAVVATSTPLAANPSPHPSSAPTPPINRIQSSAVKAIDSTLKNKGAGISWQATAIVGGTYGEFVPKAPAKYAKVPVFEITLKATAHVSKCSTGPGCAQILHATEKAVVTQSTYQTLWVSGTSAPI